MSRSAALFVMFLAVLPVHAEESAEAPADMDALTAVLNESVVSGASRSAESSSTAPATVTVITAEDLRRYGIRSLDEALNFLSLGMVTQNPLHSVDIGARGVLLTADFGNHVLLLLNGQILNEPWNGTGYFERGAAVPWELVDHIEVILGPGSVLYGSNAMLGVVNLVTRKASDYGRALLTLEAEASAPVDAQSQLQSPRLNKRYFSDVGTGIRVAGGGSHQFRLLNRSAEVVGQLEYFSSEGPSFTFGPQSEPKTFGPRSLAPGIWGGVARESYWTRVPAGHLRLAVGNLQVELRGATYSRATPYMNDFNMHGGDFDDPNNAERDRFYNTDIRYRRAMNGRLTLLSRLYGGLYDYRQTLTHSAAEDCPSSLAGGCFETVNGTSKWVGLELQVREDWLEDGRFTTLLGADGRLRRVAGDSDWEPLDRSGRLILNAYEKGEQVLGVYAQQEARPLRWLSANVGARLDLDSRFDPRLSPRAAIAFQTGESSTAKLSYAEAFRAPTAYEMYYTDASQLAAAGLRPETVRSLEASYEQRWGAHRLLVGAFISRWRDMVLFGEVAPNVLEDAIARGEVPEGSESLSQYANVSSLRNHGLNVAVEGKIVQRLSYGLNLTAARTRRSSSDGSSATRLAVAPQLFGNARLAYEVKKSGPTLALAAFFASKRPADHAFDGDFQPSPQAPVEVDLRATLTGPLSFLEGLSYRFTAQYAFSSRLPYVVGPLQTATPDSPSAELSPNDRLRFGLQLTQRFK